MGWYMFNFTTNLVANPCTLVPQNDKLINMFYFSSYMTSSLRAGNLSPVPGMPPI
jgi:hypothetical protein